jgi:hypothetical protein
MCVKESSNLVQWAMTLTTTGFGALIGYFSAQRVSNLNALHTAENNLRAAFAPSLAVIYLAKKHRNYPGDEVPPFNVDSFLKESLLSQAAAIEVFRPHVPKSEMAAYQEAWEKYRYEVWNYGFETTTFRSDIDDPWKVFEDLLHGILQFATPKKDK